MPSAFSKDYGRRVILTKSSYFLEYMKLHEISLMQDLEKIDYVNEHHFYRCKEAEILNTRHLLSVATDIMNSSNERYE
jgi:hypothetical protein